MDAERDIKARIQRILKSSDLTQEGFAELIGSTRDAVAQYWRGRTILPIRFWKAFCQRFGISMDYLVTGTENPIIQAYNSLPERDKAIVDRLLFPDAEDLPKPSPAPAPLEKKIKSGHTGV